MTDETSIIHAAGLPAEAVERLLGYVNRSTAESTRRAYQSDLADYCAFAIDRGLDPDQITLASTADYLATRAGEGAAVSTLERRFSGLNAVRRARGLEPLTKRHEPLASVWKGIQRVHGRPPHRKRALVTPDLKAVLRALPENKQGIRDKAIILIGFAGALRRSEVVGLDWVAPKVIPERKAVGWLIEDEEGLTLRFIRSKTNTSGSEEDIALLPGRAAETCPVRALKAWRTICHNGESAMFRSVDRHGNLGARLTDQSIALIVKRAVARMAAGQGATEAEAQAFADAYAGHSLRSGFVTSAFRGGATEAQIMPHSRHKKVETLIGYRREANKYADSATRFVDL